MKNIGKHVGFQAVSGVIMLLLFLTPAVSAAHTIGDVSLEPQRNLENSPTLYTLRIYNQGPDSVNLIVVKLPSGFENVENENTPAEWSYFYDNENHQIIYQTSTDNIPSFKWSPSFQFRATTPVLEQPYLQNYNFWITTRDNYGNYDNSSAPVEVVPAVLLPSHDENVSDEDGDSSWNFLTISIPFKVDVSGWYRIMGDLWSDNWENQDRIHLGYTGLYNSFGVGEENVALSFRGADINYGGYTGRYWVEISALDEQYNLLSRQEFFTENTYNYQDFEEPPIRFTSGHHFDVDNGGDNLIDSLIVHVQVSVSDPGEYFVDGELWNSSFTTPIAHAHTNPKVDENTTSVDLVFRGREIQKSGENSPYILNLFLWDPKTEWHQENDNALTINGYTYNDFEPSPARLMGSFNDNARDVDNDDLYDYLEVEVGVEVREDNKYVLEGDLHDNDWNWITFAREEVFLSTENTKITLHFKGSDIRNSGENGPYWVSVRFYTLNWEWLGDASFQTDNSYRAEDFTTPAAYIVGVTGEATENDDNYIENLVITVQLYVKDPGVYHLGGDLSSMNGRWITFAWYENFLENGTHYVNLKFRGSEIYLSKENSPYTINIWLSGGGEESLAKTWTSYTTTNNYVYENFARPPAYIEKTGHVDTYWNEGPDNEWDYVVVRVKVKINENGVYALHGALVDNDWNLVAWCENRGPLTTSDNYVELWFEGSQIRNSLRVPTKVSLDLFDANWYWLGWEEHTLQHVYPPENFEKAPISIENDPVPEGRDIDDDGQFNYLVVDLPVNVTRSGRYHIQADLEWENNQTFRQWISWAENNPWLPLGSHTVQLRFSGLEIYRSQLPGPYKLTIRIFGEGWEWFGENSYTLSGYSYDNFQAPPVRFSPPHTNYAVDTDDDGLYNYIVENVRLNVVKGGKYRIGGMIAPIGDYGGPENPITFALNEVQLNPGDNQFVSIVFDASRIYPTGENGPYFVGIALLNEDFEPILFSDDTTLGYTYTQFEQPVARLLPPHSDSGLDRDNDNYYDYLEVTVNVKVKQLGTYTLAGFIWYENAGSKPQPIDWRENTLTLSAGIQQVNLRFDGYGIVKNRVQGRMYVELMLLDSAGVIVDATMENPYQTEVYSYQQFEPTKTGHFAVVAGLPVPPIPAGRSASIAIGDNEVGVTEVDITTKSNLSGAELDVTEHSEKPPGARDPGGTPLNYLDITVTGSDNVKSAVIHFRISKSKVNELGIDVDNLTLMHYNSEFKTWEKLETTLENEDSEYYYFSAVTYSFSWFVVVGKVVEGGGEETPGPGGGITPTPTPTVGASFEFSVFEIPDVIKIGETAIISFVISNTGDEAGSYTVILSLDNQVLETREVTLNPGENQEVRFEVVPPAVGTFVIQIAGETATLKVEPELTVSQELVALSLPPVYVDKIDVGVPAEVQFTEGYVQKIAISVWQAVSGVVLKVKQLRDKPSGVPNPEGTVFSYLEITAEKLPENTVNAALINFKVDRRWMEENSIAENAITLLRYHGGEWQALETEKYGEDENFIYYAAISPGFSVFAISGEKGSTAPAPGVTPTLPTQPFAPLPPIYLVIITAIMLIGVIVLIVWRYISIGTRELPRK